ncbi:MAG TPA: lysophospholipid acyltransferase family protein [Candidatus Angelobacter sp.]|nr:lysophospholipid acyltransferase family protein [Candidatus Angelobacter sp.]
MADGPPFQPDASAPRRLPLRDRLLATVLSWIVPAIVSLIGLTLRFDIDAPDATAEEGSLTRIDELYPGIFVFWHRCVLPAMWIFRHRNLGAVTSESRDGEYIARVIQRMGFVPIRGSSSRGGRRAMLEMRQLVTQGGGVAFTIDGPRGPRHVAKRGPVVLARVTGVPIVPFYVALDRAWVLNTWDRMLIPKPFAHVYIRAARKIYVPADADEATMDHGYSEMQAALERVTTFAESQFSSPRNGAEK